MTSGHPVIVVSGPTATGKTSTSLRIAHHLIESGQEPIIVNFDSLLFYKEISVGTAKPTPEEMGDIPHEMIGIRSLNNPMNASEYVKEVSPIIEMHQKKNRTILLVGGSGFYLRALIKGMYESPTISPPTMDRSNTLYQQEGISPFRDILKKHDLVSYNHLHENDHYRIRRAVEHYWTTGQPFSDQKKKFDEEGPFDFSKNIHPDWAIHHLYLDIPKPQHWEIIIKRTEQMVENGLIEEVEELMTNNFTGSEKPLQSIGYKETLDFLKGEISSKEALIEAISISTRQLAKAQRTFFSKVTPKTSLNPLSDGPQIDEFIGRIN